MARQEATTTLSPASEFATGAEIYFEDTVEVLEQLNWSFGQRPQLHLACATGDETWTTNGAFMLGAIFRPIATGWVEVFRTRLKLLPETINVICGARCVFGTLDTGEVRFTLGADSVTLGFTAADNGTEKEGLIDTATSGTGWQTLRIEIRRTGASQVNPAIMRNLRVQDEAIAAASLPAPAL